MTSVRNFMAGLSDRAIDRICCGGMAGFVLLALWAAGLAENTV